MTETCMVRNGDIEIAAYADGPADGPAVVFANSLGTDHSMWTLMLPYLPKGLRLIRYDKRGHGRSSVPPAPYTMGQLVADAEAVCDAFEARDAVFVGLSVGGLIAQGLAVKRLDIVRAMVLSNTGARIGNHQMWDDRIAILRKGGLAALADATMERWFGAGFRATPAVTQWRDLLLSTPLEGYIGTAHAIAGSDFYTTTASLRLPTLGIAGSEDGATPPDLVREAVALVPGSKFELIRKAGHLPCIDKPETYAALLSDFLRDVGHI